MSTKRKRPERLPKGLIVEDIGKKSWKLGAAIGAGGFGDIYAAQSLTAGNKNNYVIKIEPHTNGTLFVEINFYIRNAKLADNFKAQHSLSFLGMPEYLGSGSHEYNGVKYRFLVMHLYGSDIMKLYLDNGRTMPEATVFKICVELLDVLEYIHSRGYIHGDVKPTNVLLENEKTPKHVYLVDFGMCTRESKTLKRDPKKAHNGTIEYLSRDAHNGVMSRRGDLEILAYNLIQLLGGKLPWLNCLTKPVDVQQSKETHMTNPTLLLNACFDAQHAPPTALTAYLAYVANLAFEDRVDYAQLRKILVDGAVKGGGASLTGALVFGGSRPASTVRRSRNASARRTMSPRVVAAPARKAEAARTTKKRPAQAKPAKVEQPAVVNGVKKRAGGGARARKPIAATALTNGDAMADEHAMNGFTAEMVRIKTKLMEKKAAAKAAPKKKATTLKTTTRRSIVTREAPLRRRKAINYNEDRVASDVDED